MSLLLCIGLVRAVLTMPASDRALVTTPMALPSLREQAQIRAEWVQYRLQTQLPPLLREHRLTHWVLSQREYHEDVAWRSVASPTQINARRRTVIVYSLAPSGEGVTEHTFVSFEDSIWSEVAAALGSTGAFAIDIDTNFAFSDGLAAGEYEAMSKGLGPAVMSRAVRTPMLAMDFIALRAPSMLEYYRSLMANVHAILDLALSSTVITAGVTTCDDVRWWLRDETVSRGFSPGFHPSFALQRRGVDGFLTGDTVIQKGDLVWVDYGVIAMGLWTDTQWMGYVLDKNEQVPDGITEGFKQSNRVQDIVVEQLTAGKTGNEVLRDVVTATTAEGIDALIYTHPIGDHMHGAGATIGLSDKQNNPIPIKGDVKVLPETWYSIELGVTAEVPEWGGQKVKFQQEEDAAIDASGRAQWVLARQSSVQVIFTKDAATATV